MPRTFDITQISEWSRYMARKIAGLRPIQGDGMLISKKAKGYLFELDFRSLGGSVYLGPFKCSKDPDTDNKVIVAGYDETKNQYAHNYAFVGLERIETTGDTLVTVSGNGVVYAHIDYNDPNYEIEYLYAATLPDQTKGNVYIELATVRYADSKITNVFQTQYGHIHVSGRVV